MGPKVGPETGPEAGPEMGTATSERTRGRARRELVAVLALCAAGSGLALLASGEAWLQLTAPRTPPMPDFNAPLTGLTVAPLVSGLAVVGLAGTAALLATRARGRLVVGVLVAAAGLGIALRAVRYLAAPSAERAWTLLADAQSNRDGAPLPSGVRVAVELLWWWPLIAVVGGLLVLAGGLGAILRSRRWPAMSARYEAPATFPADRPSPRETRLDGLWEAIDRGDDPTAR
jgi:uncharacterized membrane protein (TIGR02234 family)